MNEFSMLKSKKYKHKSKYDALTTEPHTTSPTNTVKATEMQLLIFLRSSSSVFIDARRGSAQKRNQCRRSIAHALTVNP